MRPRAVPHEAQSHFWTGTAPYVLTLYDVLPASVPIVVAWSPALERMFAMLDVDPRRLVRFDTAATYYAKVLYSVVPSPYGAHGALGGEPSGAPAFARVQKHSARGAAAGVVAHRDRRAQPRRPQEPPLQHARANDG